MGAEQRAFADLEQQPRRPRQGLSGGFRGGGGDGENPPIHITAAWFNTERRVTAGEVARLESLFYAILQKVKKGLLGQAELKEELRLFRERENVKAEISFEGGQP